MLDTLHLPLNNFRKHGSNIIEGEARLEHVQVSVTRQPERV